MNSFRNIATNGSLKFAEALGRAGGEPNAYTPWKQSQKRYVKLTLFAESRSYNHQWLSSPGGPWPPSIRFRNEITAYGRTSWKRDRLVVRPLPTQGNAT
jgi:hypothetical protein